MAPLPFDPAKLAGAELAWYQELVVWQRLAFPRRSTRRRGS
jgi:hypothetical protein